MTQEEMKTLSQMINDTLNVRFDAFEEKMDAKLDARFETFEKKLDAKLDARFETFEKKLDAKLDARFETFEKKLDAKLDVRFETFEKKMDAKLDAKFETFREEMDAKLDTRFDAFREELDVKLEDAFDRKLAPVFERLEGLKRSHIILREHMQGFSGHLQDMAERLECHSLAMEMMGQDMLMLKQSTVLLEKRLLGKIDESTRQMIGYFLEGGPEGRQKEAKRLEKLWDEGEKLLHSGHEAVYNAAT